MPDNKARSNGKLHDAMVLREAELGIAAIAEGRFEWIENSAQLMASIRQELRGLERAEVDAGTGREPRG